MSFVGASGGTSYAYVSNNGDQSVSGCAPGGVAAGAVQLRQVWLPGGVALTASFSKEPWQKCLTGKNVLLSRSRHNAPSAQFSGHAGQGSFLEEQCSTSVLRTKCCPLSFLSKKKKKKKIGRLLRRDCADLRLSMLSSATSSLIICPISSVVTIPICFRILRARKTIRGYLK